MIEERKSIILNITNNNPVRCSEKYFKKNFNDIYGNILEHFSKSNLKIDILFKEKIWLWVNDSIDLPKCHCGNYTKINPNWLDGFRRNCSVKCSSIDKIRIDNAKKSTKEKYGSENYFNTDDYKQKVKKSNLEKYGVDHYSKTDEYKEKIKKTNLDRYGTDHYSKTDEYKEKVKNTSLSKYGVDNYAKTEESKEKVKNTSLSKYGVDNYTKTDEYKIKTKETNLSKYNFPYYTQTNEHKIKTKETNLIKYGVDHYSKTDEYKEKIANTSLSKYNELHYSKTDECKNKIKETNLLKYGMNSHTQSEEHRKDKYKIANNPFYIHYINNNNNLFKCDCGYNHNFEILTTTYYSRYNSNLPICTICYPLSTTPSFNELSYKSYIEDIYSGEIIPNYRDGFEIDIYLPELKLGFEFNGLYWHSDEHKNKNYHLFKTNHFKDKGIRIIHIWEDDWNFKTEIIKSQIKNLLKLNTIKIFSRKCEIKEVNVKDARLFLDNNHIQGFVNSNIKIGLYYNDELVSLMTFDKYEGRKKMDEYEWNLNRFCNKINTNVIGSASKLLKYFINEYKPNRIISYADKDWSIGDLYYKLGFEYVNETPPDYKYIVNKKRTHKSNYKKTKLKTDLTENEQMKLNSINKIYDCGKIKFQLINI
jgi:hypothetical protein